MYAYTFKHIDSSADSREVMKVGSHLLKTAVSFGWSENTKENAENIGGKVAANVDFTLFSIREVNRPAGKKNSF